MPGKNSWKCRVSNDSVQSKIEDFMGLFFTVEKKNSPSEMTVGDILLHVSGKTQRTGQIEPKTSTLLDSNGKESEAKCTSAV